MKRTISLLLLNAAIIITAGCTSVNQAITGTVTNQVAKTVNGSVQLNNTNVTVGKSATIPANWPKEIPFPKNIILTSALNAPKRLVVTFSTTTSATDSITFYKNEVTSLGWTQTASGEANQGQLWAAKKGNQTLQVAATPAKLQANQTEVVVSLLTQ